MQLFQLTVAALFTNVAFGALEDDVACAFNKFREANKVEPFKISTRLMQTANESAIASLAARKTVLVIPGDTYFSDRMTRAGYEHSSAYALGGKGYKAGKPFAEAMIEYAPDHIKDPELKHIGYAYLRSFSNVDFGDSYNDDEPTRDAICPTDS